MNMLQALCLLCVFIGSQAQSDRTFNCALPSLCNDVSIDPRAGVPDQILSPGTCPTGTIQCNSVKCGAPTSPISSSNGRSNYNSIPWQAYLQDGNNKYIGGGVLVDQYNVLTAAHKVYNITAMARMTVLMGVNDPKNTPGSVQRAQVRTVYMHSSFDVNNLKNDVAILRLNTPINIVESAMSICLPSGMNFVPVSDKTRCLVSGWGQTGFTVYDAPTTDLKQVYVPIVTSDECTRSYQPILGDRTSYYLDTASGLELCAGGDAQLDSCTQDGGSPLVCKNQNGMTYTLAGLVLWGKGCGVERRFGVYLNVPNYMTWISSTLHCSRQNSGDCNMARVYRFNV